MEDNNQDPILEQAIVNETIETEMCIRDSHCIGVDPYYLTYKSNELGYKPQIILSGRNINDGMPHYIAKKVVQYLLG